MDGVAGDFPAAFAAEDDNLGGLRLLVEGRCVFEDHVVAIGGAGVGFGRFGGGEVAGLERAGGFAHGLQLGVPFVGGDLGAAVFAGLFPGVGVLGFVEEGEPFIGGLAGGVLVLGEEEGSGGEGQAGASGHHSG